MRYCDKCGAEITGRFCTACGNDCQAKKENVEETLGKLYTLRAGISYVSKENGIYIHEDHINKSNYNLIKGQVANNERDVRNMHKQQLSNIAAKELYNENLCDDLRYRIECEKNEQKLINDKKGNVLKSTEKGELILRFIAVICIVFFVIINGSTLFFDFFLGAIIHFVLPIILGVVAYIAAEWDIFYKISNSKEKIKNLEKEYSESSKRQGDYERELRAQEGFLSQIKGIEKTECRIKVVEEKLVLERKELLVAEKKYNDALPHLHLANSVYEALKNEYVPILDVRDWENLDLVIYYLETGRADNIKEALQQVDRHEHEQSMEKAMSQINNTLVSGFSEMNNTIIKCASIISTQLQNISLEQRRINENISSLTGSVINVAAFSANTLKQALKEKSNVSSKQLMDDVHQMRIYAENAEIKKRNS